MVFKESEEKRDIFKVWTEGYTAFSKMWEDACANFYKPWIESTGKMFDELLLLPAMEGTKEIFERYTGVPEIYLKFYVQTLKPWRDSYTKLYKPWMESTIKISEKIMEISQGEAGPEAYREFYDLWMVTYRENFVK